MNYKDNAEIYDVRTTMLRDSEDEYFSKTRIDKDSFEGMKKNLKKYIDMCSKYDELKDILKYFEEGAVDVNSGASAVVVKEIYDMEEMIQDKKENKLQFDGIYERLTQLENEVFKDEEVIELTEEEKDNAKLKQLISEMGLVLEKVVRGIPIEYATKWMLFNRKCSVCDRALPPIGEHAEGCWLGMVETILRKVSKNDE